jgi:hypothetical protein
MPRRSPNASTATTAMMRTRTRALREARAVARRLVGSRNERGERALIGAAVLGAAALGTAVVLERRVVADVLSEGLDTTARFGRTLAEATGLRRRPLYVRVLPGAGIATGLVAAACAAYFVTSRMMASRQRLDLGPGTQREPTGQWNPLDPLEPPDPPPERPAGPGKPNDHV